MCQHWRTGELDRKWGEKEERERGSGGPLVREVSLWSEGHWFKSLTSRIYVGGESEGNCLPNIPWARLQLHGAVLGSFKVWIYNCVNVIRLSLKERVRSQWEKKAAIKPRTQRLNPNLHPLDLQTEPVFTVIMSSLQGQTTAWLLFVFYSILQWIVGDFLREVYIHLWSQHSKQTLWKSAESQLEPACWLDNMPTKSMSLQAPKPRHLDSASLCTWGCSTKSYQGAPKDEYLILGYTGYCFEANLTMHQDVVSILHYLSLCRVVLSLSGA